MVRAAPIFHRSQHINGGSKQPPYGNSSYIAAPLQNSPHPVGTVVLDGPLVRTLPQQWQAMGIAVRSMWPGALLCVMLPYFYYEKTLLQDTSS